MLFFSLVNAEDFDYYAMNLNYNNGQLTIDSIELKTSNFLPEFSTEKTEGMNQNYVTILDNQNLVLDINYFYFSNRLYYDVVDDISAENPEIISGDSVELKETSYSVYVSYYENARYIILYDVNGMEIDKWDLSTNARYAAPGAETSSGSGVGGGIYIPKIINIKSEDIEKGITKTINAEQTINIQISSGAIAGVIEPHTVKTTLINNNQVKIIISSEPQEKILSVGEEWKIDVNGDGNYELMIKLNSIQNNHPVLSLKYINETFNSNDTEETPGVVENTGQETSKLLEQIIIPLVLAIILLLVILFVWKPWKKR